MSAPSEFPIKEVHACLQEEGVTASASMGLRPDADISSESASVVQEGQLLLLDAVKAVAAVGGSTLCGVIYAPIQKHDQPASKASRDNAVSSLRHVAAQAADQGVSLAVEIINRYESNLLNTAEQGVRLVEAVGAPNVGLHLDTYHMNIEEGNLRQAVLTAMPHLSYVHIGENHRGYLGQGHIDLPAIFQALVQGGYQGPITFESFSTEVVSPYLSNALAVWRNLWSDSEDLAAHAREYMHVQLQTAHRAGLH